MSPRCPPEEVWVGVLSGLSDEFGQTAQWEDHLEDCARCQETLERLAGESALRAAPPTMAPSAALDQAMERLKRSPTVDQSESSEVTAWLEPADGPDLLGRLEGLEVRRILARGGMGIVLEARDPKLDRLVAVKVLDPVRVHNESARERFLREARAAAALNHEHVMPVFAVSQSPRGLPYLVMPLIDGETLQQKLDRDGPPPFEETVRMGFAIARGLEAAHAAGLIHADIKPANILLGAEGRRVWLADFGLVQAADDSGRSQRQWLAGTPQYMAPEQVRGEPPTERSDLFSLGGVFHALLTGRPPFSGKNVSEVMAAVSMSHPTPRPAASSNQAWFNKLTDRLLSKDPADRPASARDVAEIIEARSRPRRVVAWWLSSAAALVAVACGVSLFTRPKSPPPGFFVVGQSRGHFSLAEAIQAAGSGDTVEIRQGAPIDGATLPIISRPLHLRAGEGYEPEITRADPGGPNIRATADVFLEGVTFRQPYFGNDPAGRPPPPFIHVWEGARAILGHCALERPQRINPLANVPPAIQVSGEGGEAELWGCEITTPNATALWAHEGTRRMSVRNSVVMAQRILVIDSGAAELDFRSRQSLFMSGSGIVFPPNHPARPTRLELDRCAWLSRDSLIWMPRHKLEDFTSRVRLHSRGNIFPRAARMFSTSDQRAMHEGPALIGLDDWERLSQREGHAPSRVISFRDLAKLASSPMPRSNARERYDRFTKELREAAKEFGDTACSLDSVGPGEPWRTAQKDSAYRAWRDQWIAKLKAGR